MLTYKFSDLVKLINGKSIIIHLSIYKYLVEELTKEVDKQIANKKIVNI